MRHTNYDDIANAYDRRYSEEDYGGIERALVEFVGDCSGGLEVGCGTGHWLNQLQKRGINAVGIDPSLPMLSRAWEKLARRALIRARAENLPLADCTFDRIFCINAHHHFADKPSFLSEAHRVLRPGGLLMTVALDPHAGADQWWVYDYFDGTLAIDHERYPSCEQIRDWMRTAGFTDTYSRVVQHEAGGVGAEAALRNGTITPRYTSQLAVLTGDELLTGLRRIEAEVAVNKGLQLWADLRVYATYGRRGSI